MSRLAVSPSFLVVALVLLAPVVQAQWVQFSEQTDARLDVADPSLVRLDPHEKEYAWADLDQDGDDDLVIVRKEPYINTAAPLPNVLLINEDGVLTDRTADFVSASDVTGDQGFLTPTTDRDIAIVDLDLDGWLDMVTAPTLSNGAPKHIGHPRVYMNLGCSGACDGTDDWLGFRYEDARIPTMLSYSGQSGFNPCFCSVGPGDVNGDGYPDLFFVDYDDGCGQPGADFNSRLLMNLGAAGPGQFVDETDPRFDGLVGGSPFVVNTDSLAGYIVDLNGDDKPEVILESEGIIDIAYNDPTNEGFYDTYDTISAFSTYFMNVADLNNDGLLDFIATDDAADRYFLNQGAGGPGIPQAEFISYVYQFQHTGVGTPPADDGFGDDSRAADLNNDGWLDVVTADRDFTSPGCNRRGHIYRNLGGEPGDQVVLREETTGSGCGFFQNFPTCLVATIPADRLKGTDDFGILDIDGDGWLDIVLGTCSGTSVYMNVPPVDPAGSVPDGDTVPGSMLMLDSQSGGMQLSLSWGASCSPEDTDYSVYAGVIGGDFSEHGEVACSTGGATTLTIGAALGSTYYLVVPHNGAFEGSYGVGSDGEERKQGSSACRPSTTESCQ